jgi:hypothetical protein
MALIIAQIGWLIIGAYAFERLNVETTWLYGIVLIVSIGGSIFQLPYYRRLA